MSPGRIATQARRALLPGRAGNYDADRLTDFWPSQHSGVQWKRT
jgi:hypothetical protein